VHRPALALAGAGHLASKFRPEFLRGDALGQLVVQTAVDGDQIVILIHRCHHRRGYDLLAAHGIIDNLQLAGTDHLPELDVRLHDQVGSRENVDEDVFVRHVC